MTLEVLEYRLDHQTEILQRHSENIMALTENLKTIEHSILRLQEANRELLEDMQERKHKRYLFHLFTWIYPIVIAGMILFTNLDHARLLEVADQLEGIATLAKDAV